MEHMGVSIVNGAYWFVEEIKGDRSGSRRRKT